MHQLSTPEHLFAELVRTDPSRPFVTYYDEATGERSELSVKSLANWVAKTHHLLTDELGLGVGDTALVVLPAHWISVPVLLGCLSAGLSLDVEGGAEVAFVTPEHLPAAEHVLDRYVIAPESAATGFAGEAPDGANDYVAAVRPQADAWAGVSMPGTDGDRCLVGRTRGEIVVAARARAADMSLPDGGRLMTTRQWSTPDDWLDAVLTPLCVGGSTVIVRNAEGEDVLDRRAQQERITVRVG